MTSEFDEFFRAATGHRPHNYQLRLALEPWFRAIEVPTGLGKTEAVIAAWLWKTLQDPDATPRRLVYVLPLRVLVEQTFQTAIRCVERLDRLGGTAVWVDERREVLQSYRPTFGEDGITVHLLMGGEKDEGWDIWPDSKAILVGTQDMIFSRLLNRGYGSSRYKWPLHYALLNNDALMLLDEVQLMGDGLATSAQVDLSHEHWGNALPSRFLWMSATLTEGILDTRDRRDREVHEFSELEVLRIGPCDPERELLTLKASKNVCLLGKAPTPRSTKSDGVLDLHVPGTISLVFLNTVPAAQAFLGELEIQLSKDPNANQAPDRVLLHGRMRPCDRAPRLDRLLKFESLRKEGKGVVSGDPGVVVVCTQVLEAGVDVSAARLWSELAPWSSVIQRLGRLNRDGLTPDAVANFWEPKADKKIENAGDSPNVGRVGPYEVDTVLKAKRLAESLIATLNDGKPYRAALDKILASPESTEALRLNHYSVIRLLDMHELFSTEPDLAKGYTDIAPYVRSVDRDVDAYVFWGDFTDHPAEKFAPAHDILCSVPFYVLSRFLRDRRASAWKWNRELRRYERVRSFDVRPGMTLLVAKSVGGYSEELGWTGQASDVPKSGLAEAYVPESFDSDRWSDTEWQSLDDHVAAVVAAARELVSRFPSVPDALRHAVVTAAIWHDVGKAHEKWQGPLREAAPRPAIWGKFKNVNPFRPPLRHEVASALAAWQYWLGDAGDGLTALALYLIAAHHGKARTVLRSRNDSADAFGIREGDRLPAVGPLHSAIELSTVPKLFGSPGHWSGSDSYEVEMPSWVGLVAGLLGRIHPGNADEPNPGVVLPSGEPQGLGPYRLAFLEALLIASDRRESSPAVPGSNAT